MYHYTIIMNKCKALYTYIPKEKDQNEKNTISYFYYDTHLN